MTLLPRITLFGLAAMLVAAGASFVLWQQATAQDPELAPRAFLPMLARDTGAEPLPPADPSYCEVPAGPTTAPAEEAIFGSLRIGGLEAPVGTVVQVFFDGKAGPAVRTQHVGFYDLRYDIGSTGCANHPGAVISLAIAGTTVATGIVVDDDDDIGELFNVTIP